MVSIMAQVYFTELYMKRTDPRLQYLKPSFDTLERTLYVHGLSREVNNKVLQELFINVSIIF